MAAVAERAEAAGFVTVAPPRRLAGCEAWVGPRRAGPLGVEAVCGRVGRPEAQVRRPRVLARRSWGRRPRASPPLA